MQMKVLLIEDNPEQVARLVKHIRECLGQDTEILGPYDQFADVIPLLAEKQIELAFVDIQLHSDLFAGIHIAEMLQQLEEIPILFVSGITDHEVVQKAEKVRHSDFLQKPYDRPGFERAISRVLRNQQNGRNGTIRIAFNARARDKYWIKTDRSEYRAVSPNQILCVEAWDHYCKIHVSGFEAPLLPLARLKEDIFEGGLNQHHQFLQLRRNVVVNMDHVEKVSGNVLSIQGLKGVESRNLTIPKDKRKEVFNLLGITD